MIKHIPSSAVVLELGGGTGSNALHEHWTCVTVEHDQRWSDYLRRTGCTTHQSELTEGWYTLDHTLKQLIQTADVVVIDGPPGTLRGNAAPHLHLIKAGAFVIFDDSHRREVKRMIEYPEIHTITDDDGRRTTTITKKPCPTAQSIKPDDHG